MNQESIQKSLEAAKLVSQFCQHIDTMKQMVDNNMLKDNDKFQDISEIHSDAYFSTIYFCTDEVVKAKAIVLLDVCKESWFPELDMEILEKYSMSTM